ncbi:5'-methylthioadenosine/S-adenosylhomocysteine nucleosidase [Actinokineospora auranticolor]|uniref:Nucleoside phosphorylase n=1 Tax=Actinokineospora auranticolor TaxID=155976 RepID=A0A2S6GBC4_9PSEU|nr:5'-methylthioadenosine/S-adenosylhomocysteine nucleosidase [Actinokineospora auranticolor]PPK61001.1 nucleoside phosphorylase [Actinokineospora auranticolor]
MTPVLGESGLVAVLTALPSEYVAVRGHLRDIRPRTHPAGTLFEVGQVANGRAVALAGIGMGNMSAASLTERMITEFAPAAVMFVGIAGGLRDRLALGDVVVATRVYAPHGGRSETDGFRSRPRAFDVSHRLEQAARRTELLGRWRDALDDGPRPAVHFDPVVAGDVVLDSRESDHAHHLRQHYNDAVAVEMESAGFAQAAHLNEKVPMLVVRGISDLAGGAKRDTDAGGWQEVAARNAAAFAMCVAADVEIPTGAPGRPVDGGDPVNGSGPVVRNIVRGNGRVGQQIGVSYGAITIHQEEGQR